MDEMEQQGLTDHLTDLRSALVRSLLAVIVCFATAYYYIEPVSNWVVKPLFDVLPEGSSLIFISYQEAFFFNLKLALTAGVLFASPVLFYEAWKFIAPGLYSHEKKVALPFTFLSSFCFLGGAAFGYYFVFPPAFKFLMGYSTDFLKAAPTVKEYFSLALRLLIAFGAIFELPVVMVILAKIGIVDAPFLRKNRKYAFLIAFIIAAILTPTPDVVNQMMMGIPLVILYEISIIGVWLFGKKRLPGFEDGAAVEEE